jgi:trk system potassium uptake protein TrkA
MVSSRSPLVGRALGDRKPLRPHNVIGLIRAGRTVPAEPGHRVKAGDHILIAAAREDIAVEVAHLGGHIGKVRDVVIFGGGRVGMPLARRLEQADRFRITVMESDGDRARELAEQLRHSTVLHEEGISKEVMLAHGVDRSGAFVACAGDDRANLLTALHAKQLGADLCLAVVSRDEYTPLVDALGIDAAFSPRLVTAEAILRAVRGGNVAAVHLMIGGAELVELEVDAGCRAEHRTVRDVSSMALTHVAAIARGDRVIIPGPEQNIRAGDRIVVFNTRPGVADIGGTFRAAA